jgi:hypothetical protein
MACCEKHTPITKTLFCVEQDSEHPLDIYSNDGGHVGMTRDFDGVDVRTENGDAFFYNSAHIDYQ